MGIQGSRDISRVFLRVEIGKQVGIGECGESVTAEGGTKGFDTKGMRKKESGSSRRTNSRIVIVVVQPLEANLRLGNVALFGAVAFEGSDCKTLGRTLGAVGGGRDRPDHESLYDQPASWWLTMWTFVKRGLRADSAGLGELEVLRIRV